MGALYPELDAVSYAYDGGIVVDVDDLMFHDANDAKPASSQADQLSELANQLYFAARFAGVAIERKVATDAAGTVDVVPDWVGEMACASATFEVGDLVAVDEAGSGTALEDQKLVKTTDAAAAIGYVLRREASAVTTALVRLKARVTPDALGSLISVSSGGLKVARGQHTTVDADDTVVTGLATVVAAVASLDSDPVDGCQEVTATIGDQAGAPAAGSIQIKTWAMTAANNATLAPAGTFTKKVNWVAIGT